ncbi:MAG: DNA polymerase III subunit alpha, partial [Planctomycetota bacterium]|nr:DNA polymerase III subunit alpha [Planctomycetota bacterium]
ITFGKMKARAVLRDVGRSLGVPLGEVDALAKKVPQVLDITLRDAIRMEPEIQKDVDSDPQKKELWEISLKLEGLNRHASKHACGIVISDRILDELVPVYVMDSDEITQFDMNILTKLGMLKIDVLGLEMLSVLSRAVRLIDPTMDLDKIPLDDKKTYDMLAKGRVKGVFQLETSRGMRELIQQMKPDRIEEVIASIAMFRPGPLQSGMVETYVKCKHGQEEVKYLHPMLEPILKETHGVILYQEQVMRIANQMAGLPMSDCDALRKAMGKKKPEILAQFKEMFIEGAEKQNVSGEVARAVFDLMAFFGGYGFNKSHSAAYGILCYQTAYLKANYPLQYMAALMSCTMGNAEKMAEYIEECRQMEIEVLPPDINLSSFNFTVEDGKIRVGLGTVKNVGDKAVHHIIKVRSEEGAYTDFHHILENIDLKSVDKKSLECLAKAGAFDSLGILRSQFLEVLEGSLRISALRRQDRQVGQMSIFGQEAHEDYPPLPEIEEWPQETLLGYEKDALGFYVSSNPLVRYEDLLNSYSTTTVDRLGDIEDGKEVTIGGILTGLRTMIAKTGANKGNKFIGYKIADLTGVCEAVSFPKEYAKNQDHFFEDHIVFATGRVSFRNENVSLRVTDIVPAMKAREVLTGTATVEIPSTGDSGVLEEVNRVLEEHPGTVPVLLEVALGGARKVLVRASDRCMISPSEAFIADIDDVLGSGHLRFSGKSLR